MTCENCKYAGDKVINNNDLMAPKMVECKQYPPAVSVAMTNQGPVPVVARPSVKVDDSCGEFELKAPKIVS